jgi:hypothetical protein
VRSLVVDIVWMVGVCVWGVVSLVSVVLYGGCVMSVCVACED